MNAVVKSILIVLGFVFVCPVAHARAQGPSGGPRWEVEVHGGGLLTSSPTSGTPIAQFPGGAPLATGFGTTTSREVSSWFFGDGSVLLNQVNAGFGVSPRLTPLDGALKKPLSENAGGFAGGVRRAPDRRPPGSGIRLGLRSVLTRDHQGGGGRDRGHTVQLRAGLAGAPRHRRDDQSRGRSDRSAQPAEQSRHLYDRRAQ